MIGPKIDQIWAWLHHVHRRAVGVRDYLKILVSGPSFSVNCYLENQINQDNCLLTMYFHADGAIAACWWQYLLASKLIPVAANATEYRPKIGVEVAVRPANSHPILTNEFI